MRKLSSLAPLAAAACALAVPAAAHANGYQDAVMADGPGLYWPLNDAAGSATVQDATAGDHDGTVSGGVSLGADAPFALAQTGAALNGGSIAGDPGAVQRIAEFWVRPRVNNVQQTFLAQGDAATTGWEVGVGAKRKLVVKSGTSVWNPRIMVRPGRWTMVTVAWTVKPSPGGGTATTVRLLTNAGYAQDKEKTLQNTSIAPASTAVTVGHGVLGDLDGAIDEVALYPASDDVEGDARARFDASTLPQNLTLPSISGSLADRQTLTVTAGTWTGAPTLEHQWIRCDSSDVCTDVPGATGTTYTLTPADVGSTLIAEETATNVNGTTFVDSAETGVVQALAPFNVTAPSLSGIATEGEVLSAVDGSWDGTPTLTFGHRWQRCDAAGANCADVAGATGSTYGLTSADAGLTVRVVVRAANAGGGTDLASPASPVIATAADAGTAPGAAEVPAVDGSPVDGGTLSATPGLWTGNPAPSFAYQWQRCAADGTGCLDVDGATGQAYDLTGADVDHTIRVHVTATNASGDAQADSAVTAVVTAKPVDPGTDPGTTTPGGTTTDAATPGGTTTGTTTPGGPTTGTTPVAGTATCRVSLARVPKARRATVRGIGRVRVRIHRGKAGTRVLVRAPRRKVARVAFKLDRKVLKG
ncbi:MAG TPA: hypothetical protein VLB47_06590, partial [Solirubrobacteraceae bacterium]|nr:hypothetical protein [Solirubrobacteraceae bacterium]